MATEKSNVPRIIPRSSLFRKNTQPSVEVKDCPTFARLVENKDLTFDEKRHIKRCPRCASLQVILQKGRPELPAEMTTPEE